MGPDPGFFPEVQGLSETEPANEGKIRGLIARKSPPGPKNLGPKKVQTWEKAYTPKIRQKTVGKPETLTDLLLPNRIEIQVKGQKLPKAEPIKKYVMNRRNMMPKRISMARKCPNLDKSPK